MIHDFEFQFSDAQAITGDAISDVVDLGAAQSPHSDSQQNKGDRETYLVVSFDEDFNTLTSMTITLESDSTADLATSPTVHATRSLLLAEMAAGAGPYVIGAFSGAVNERFLGVRYNVVGTDPTTGEITAYLTHDVPDEFI